MITIIIVIIVVIVVLVLIYTSGNATGENEMERLKHEYELALLGLDKKAALKVGRLYYAIQRKDKELTIYDEQAIANDLSTMPQEIYLSKPGNNDITGTELPQPSTSTIINY
jgi:hypothetical protein